MTPLEGIALTLALGLAIYLGVALLLPEKLS
jgi:K+-transporting ATPase KdpF subunit